MALDANSESQVHLRPARESEAGFLTELALRSKGHWEYDREFLRDCRADLTITPEFVLANEVFVIEEKGIAVGFYSLERRDDGDVELEHLYVEPQAIGRGYGKQLLQHAAESSKRFGYGAMIIKSDPYAETFYKAMGATRIGESESPVRIGRMLPLLRYDLCDLAT